MPHLRGGLCQVLKGPDQEKEDGCLPKRVSVLFLILAQFDLGTRHSNTGTLVTLQLPVPSLKPCDVHTQKTKQGQVNKTFTTILPKFTKICTQSALELGQRQRAHVFDRG